MLVYDQNTLRAKNAFIHVGSYVDQTVYSMIDIMNKNMGVGLAGPQIGLNKMIFVTYHPSYPVFINPKIMNLYEPISVEEEGCLSLPGIRRYVPRYSKVIIKGYDQYWKEFVCVAESTLARVIQHEYDHLYGKLITDY